MGENARQPDAPRLPNTPLEALTPREGENFTFFDKNFMSVTGGLSGVLSVVIRNNIIRRPLWAGFHNHILFGGLGYLIGLKWNEFLLEDAAETDAILKHYITLHPEDFPPFEKKRIKDMFIPWHPSR